MNLKLIHSVKFALIDDEDFERVRKYLWSINVSPTGNSVRMTNRPQTNLSNFIIQSEKMVDHKDRNYLNNQKSNPRECNYSQNLANRAKNPNKTNKLYKGVSWDKKNKKWRASITVNYKAINLGRYEFEEDAAEAYDKAAKKAFGEFAILNEPYE